MRDCKCGCGEICGGRKLYASNACRQRAYRERNEFVPYSRLCECGCGRIVVVIDRHHRKFYEPACQVRAWRASEEPRQLGAKCEHCRSPYMKKRVSQRFCKAACRVASHRAKR